MKAKPILLSTKDKALLGLNLIHNHLFIADNMAEIPSQEYQHVYLIDEVAKIKGGDYCILDLGENTRVVRIKSLKSGHPVFTVDIESGYAQLKSLKKIIVSTDTSLGLPLLSEQSIKLLIDYYNKNGNIPESVGVDSEIDIVDIPLCPYKIKLNFQGTVDISIPEDRVYSKSDMHEAFVFGFDYANDTTGTYPTFEDWLKETFK